MKPKKSITVPLSESDCQDIMSGEEFNWTFDGVNVRLILETNCDECGDLETDCDCNN